MSITDEKVALCALNKIYGFQPLQGKELLESCSGVSELLSKLDPTELDWARKELERVRERGYRFIGYGEEDYPAPLLECEDPPLGLYLNAVTSPTEIFALRPMVAFVGTRDMSLYGKEWCIRLVRALADTPVPPCIVSGLALGVDGIAHRTALECGLPTIGVMATGVESIYPWHHRELGLSIVSTPGCGLVTDYPMGTQPLAPHFVRRNRIIAGLSVATIVIESRTRGGSLLTAKYACNYNRDVYALPGRADDPRSAGCNSLIHEHMAEIITTPEALAESLGLGAPSRNAGGSWLLPRGGASAEEVLRCTLARRYGPGSLLVDVGLAVLAHRGATPEELASALGRPYPDILSALGTLEADGVVTTDLLRRCTLAPAFA